MSNEIRVIRTSTKEQWKVFDPSSSAKAEPIEWAYHDIKSNPASPAAAPIAPPPKSIFFLRIKRTNGVENEEFTKGSWYILPKRSVSVVSVSVSVVAWCGWSVRSASGVEFGVDRATCSIRKISTICRGGNTRGGAKIKIQKCKIRRNPSTYRTALLQPELLLGVRSDRRRTGVKNLKKNRLYVGLRL